MHALLDLATPVDLVIAPEVVSPIDLLAPAVDERGPLDPAPGAARAPEPT